MEFSNIMEAQQSLQACFGVNWLGPAMVALSEAADAALPSPTSLDSCADLDCAAETVLLQNGTMRETA